MKYYLFFLSIIFFFSCKNKKEQPAKNLEKIVVNSKKENSKGVKNDSTKVIPFDIENQAVDKTPINFIEQEIGLEKGDTFNLKMPKGFSIYPSAEGLRRVRFFAKAPDGRLFVTGLDRLSDNNKGKVYILESFDPNTKRFQKITTWKDKLRNPNSVQFYEDKTGKNWLYLALTDSLVRYPYQSGELLPSGQGEKIFDFPGYGLNYKYGGWHLTRTIAFHNDKLYISVGSSCNLCEEKEEEFSRAAILEMNPDGSEVEVFAKGVRNAVDIGWVHGKFYATNMASDHLGWKKPNDYFYLLEKGQHYGWPYCYEDEGVMVEEDPKSQSENRAAKKIVKDNWDRKKINCEEVPKAYALFEPHGSPLGFEYFSDSSSSPTLRNYFLAGLHGATKPKVDRDMGHHIVRFKKGFKPEPIIDGFFQNGKQFGRPCDIIQWDESSFFFTDDHKGVVYFVKMKP